MGLAGIPGIARIRIWAPSGGEKTMSISNLLGPMDRRAVLALGGMATVAAIVGPAGASDLYGPNATGAKSGGTLNMGLLVEPPRSFPSGRRCPDTADRADLSGPLL